MATAVTGYDGGPLRALTVEEAGRLTRESAEFPNEYEAVLAALVAEGNFVASIDLLARVLTGFRSVYMQPEVIASFEKEGRDNPCMMIELTLKTLVNALVMQVGEEGIPGELTITLSTVGLSLEGGVDALLGEDFQENARKTLESQEGRVFGDPEAVPDVFVDLAGNGFYEFFRAFHMLKASSEASELGEPDSVALGWDMVKGLVRLVEGVEAMGTTSFAKAVPLFSILVDHAVQLFLVREHLGYTEDEVVALARGVIEFGRNLADRIQEFWIPGFLGASSDGTVTFLLPGIVSAFTDSVELAILVATEESLDQVGAVFARVSPVLAGVLSDKQVQIQKMTTAIENAYAHALTVRAGILPDLAAYVDANPISSERGDSVNELVKDIMGRVEEIKTASSICGFEENYVLAALADDAARLEGYADIREMASLADDGVASDLWHLVNQKFTDDPINPLHMIDRDLEYAFLFMAGGSWENGMYLDAQRALALVLGRIMRDVGNGNRVERGDYPHPFRLDPSDIWRGEAAELHIVPPHVSVADHTTVLTRMLALIRIPELELQKSSPFVTKLFALWRKKLAERCLGSNPQAVARVLQAADQLAAANPDSVVSVRRQCARCSQSLPRSGFEAKEWDRRRGSVDRVCLGCSGGSGGEGVSASSQQQTMQRTKKVCSECGATGKKNFSATQWRKPPSETRRCRACIGTTTSAPSGGERNGAPSASAPSAEMSATRATRRPGRVCSECGATGKKNFSTTQWRKPAGESRRCRDCIPSRAGPPS